MASSSEELMFLFCQREIEGFFLSKGLPIPNLPNNVTGVCVSASDPTGSGTWVTCSDNPHSVFANYFPID